MGVPVFFLLKQSGNVSFATIGMMIVMLPMIFMGIYEKHGQPLEVIAKQFIEARFIRPKERPYQTNNYYAVLMRQAWAEEEVRHIVDSQKQKTGRNGGFRPAEKSYKTGKKADSFSDGTCQKG